MALLDGSFSILFADRFADPLALSPNEEALTPLCRSMDVRAAWLLGWSEEV